VPLLVTIERKRRRWVVDAATSREGGKGCHPMSDLATSNVPILAIDGNVRAVDGTLGGGELC
jgi:hypothetical protein